MMETRIINHKLYEDEDKNSIRLSSVSMFESEIAFSGLGIKYVGTGEEVYFANDKKYVLHDSQYIIGNDYTKTFVKISRDEPVQGICIDISYQVIHEVAEYFDLHPEEMKEFLLSDQLLVNRYHAKYTAVGTSINKLRSFSASGNVPLQHEAIEFIYDLCEAVIADQRIVFSQLGRMPSKRNSTREELLRKLLDSKTFIQEHLTANFSLETIAQHAGVSKYHFLRLFKEVFGISPYKYQIEERLIQARKDLIFGVDIAYVSDLYGFADVQSFSKAFKKQFNQTPGMVRKKAIFDKRV